MKKLFVSALLLFTFVLPAKAAVDWTTVVNKVLPSVVYVESGQGSCTGFVINQEKHYVMTAAHCVPDGEGRVWLDLTAGQLISFDSKKDLAVYKVDNMDPSRPALKLATSAPKIGDEVMSVGYGMALERPFFRKAMVSDTAVQIPEEGIGGPFIGLDSAFVPGQSGGPVVNSNGEVALIVQRASGTVGIGVSADIIRERMGRFWGK